MYLACRAAAVPNTRCRSALYQPPTHDFELRGRLTTIDISIDLACGGCRTLGIAPQEHLSSLAIDIANSIILHWIYPPFFDIPMDY
jgi:hypothetical protein